MLALYVSSSRPGLHEITPCGLQLAHILLRIGLGEASTSCNHIFKRGCHVSGHVLGRPRDVDACTLQAEAPLAPLADERRQTVSSASVKSSASPHVNRSTI